MRSPLARWYEDHGQDRPLVGRFDQSDPSVFPVLDAPPPGNAPVTDLASLLTELDRIREQGYALSDEELEFGVVAASAPITDFTGRIVAAVNVSAPKARIGQRLDALGVFVSRAARSSRRGWERAESNPGGASRLRRIPFSLPSRAGSSPQQRAE